MDLSSLLGRFFEDAQRPPLHHVSAEAPSRQERRQSALRCIGCARWGGPFVYMSDGAEYCVDCARGVSALYGSTPAGRRALDIVRFD